MPTEPPRRRGILAGPVAGTERLAAEYPPVEAVVGLPLLHRASGTTGALVSHGTDHVVLRTASGAERRLKYSPGAVAHEGRAVRLVAPRARPSVGDDAPDLRGGRAVAERTASGSRAVVGAKARTARASRILVEGVHDAELIERVWGDDLRVEGVVVERLDGIDDLAAVVRDFGPARDRRLGVLVDHLVPGSKEARIAASVRDPDVLVLGTPYVDVWQAVRPATVGIDAWPVIPRGTPWKEGVAAALGEPDLRALWRRILGSVHEWGDLEQPLVLAVESLIDFVTEP
ncbi:MAG: DUF3097 family protein [Actinomycetes bacterium]